MYGVKLNDAMSYAIPCKQYSIQDKLLGGAWPKTLPIATAIRGRA